MIHLDFGPSWLRALGEELRGIPWATIGRNPDQTLAGRTGSRSVPCLWKADDIRHDAATRRGTPREGAGTSGRRNMEEARPDGPKIETDKDGNVRITIPRPTEPSAKIAVQNLKAIWSALRGAVDDAARMNDRSSHGVTPGSAILPPPLPVAAAAGVP